MKQKALSILLAAVLCLGLAAPAGAASTQSGITWSLSGDGTLTISGTGIIPDSFGSSGAMGQALGEQKTQVTRIVIKDGITAIGSDAFYSYGSLEEIIIPATVKGMDESCFSNCYKLTSVRFLGDLPHGELHGELFINGNVTVYCPKEYFENYQYLTTYMANSAHTASDYANPVRLCTSQTPVSASLNQELIILSAQKPSFQLTASLNGAAVSSGVRWTSLDPSIAAVDSSGVVTRMEKHGSTLICAEIPIGDDTALVTCQVFATRNSALVDCLPVSGVEADFPVTCNTSVVAWDGTLRGYQPGKFVETDTGNAYYQELSQLTDSLTRNCATETEKARAIQQWVSENIEYGGSLAIGNQVGQVYAVYEARSSHCQGYSYLTGFMLYLAGIPNAIAVSVGHMWNLALLDGQWVMIDSTWGEFGFDADDPGHGYITSIAFGQGDCCFIVNDGTGVKLAGVGPRTLEQERAGLTTITVPDYVNYLYDYSIAYCENLTAVYLPDSITGIEKNVFYRDKNLTDIFYAGTWEQWNAIEKSDNFTRSLSGVTIHTSDFPSGAEPLDPAEPEPIAPAGGTAYASTQTVLVDGRPVEFQAYALKDENGNDTNYVKLRDVAYVLNGTAAQFSVGWDWVTASINTVPGEPYAANGSEMRTPFSGDRSYEVSTLPLYINRQAASLEAIVLKDDADNGYTYFKLRDLGEALGFTVGWSQETGIFLETSK